MKIGFLLGRFPELSETFVINQITGLIDRGADVRIHALAGPPQPTLHSVIERYDLVRRTNYASPEAELRARRAKMLRVLLRGLVRTRGAPACVTRVLRHGRADADMAIRFPALERRPASFDVVQCHFGPYGQWAIALRNLGLLRGKVVTTFHGYDMTRYLLQFGDNVYDRLFHEGDLFLPISNYWRERLIALGCPPERTLVHRMGVDSSRFAFIDRQPPSSGQMRVLSVGRFVEKKGFEYAIRAVAAVAHRIPGIEYRIIGDGPLAPELSALAVELGAGTRITVLGSCSSEQVAGEMATAHVLLAPSVTAADGDQEGIPFVLMEAMATGLPVVSTFHTGIPELVEDGVTGYLTPERSVDHLAAALERLTVGAATYTSMARAARQTIERDFDINQLNDRLLELFGDSAHT
jgi:colanic acid/amylovoran biosynthesis glycosyltransferase